MIMILFAIILGIVIGIGTGLNDEFLRFYLTGWASAFIGIQMWGYLQ